VIDPVMVSESGAQLLDPKAHEALVKLLFPRATVITPNVPEAKALVHDEDLEPAALAKALKALGPEIVVVTGGHREQATDVFYDGHRLVELAGERHSSNAAHGSGCTHSSVLAARLAHGDDPLTAARMAKQMAAAAVQHGLTEIGAGAGPVDILDVAARPDRGALRF
jgi:hydroxymethylpyrimidine/phosphomethylpyrimidine kinase